MTVEQTEAFLVDELYSIDSMFNMYFEISNSASDYASVMSIASAFFQAARLALLENSTLRLCKLFEEDKDVVSIGKYLNKISDEPNKSSKSKALLCKEVKTCRDLLAIEKPKLNLLRELRDSFLAHNDIRMVNADPFAAVGLTIGDYRSLFALAGTIINRIRKVCNRSHILFKLVDDDDYKYILIGLSEYVKEHPDFFDKVQKEKDARERKIVISATREL